MIVPCTPDGIKIAKKTIRSGGIVVFPTDTVYGIGCDPYNANGIKRIYKIKNRKSSKLLSILCYSEKEVCKIAEFDKKNKKAAKKFWPGSLTLVLKVKDEKIRQSLHLKNKIAVRIPNTKCIQSLLQGCKLLVGTSANISGESPIKDPSKCIQKLKDYDVLVDGGKITSGGESTIVEIGENEVKILRKGSLSKEEIESSF